MGAAQIAQYFPIGKQNPKGADLCQSDGQRVYPYSTGVDSVPVGLAAPTHPNKILPLCYANYSVTAVLS